MLYTYSPHKPTARSPDELRGFLVRLWGKSPTLDVITDGMVELHDNKRKNGRDAKEHPREVKGLVVPIFKKDCVVFEAIGPAANGHDFDEDHRGPVFLEPEIFRKAVMEFKKTHSEIRGSSVVAISQEILGYHLEAEFAKSIVSEDGKTMEDKCIMNLYYAAYGNVGIYAAYIDYHLTVREGEQKEENRDRHLTNIDRYFRGGRQIRGMMDAMSDRLRIRFFLDYSTLGIRIADINSNTKHDEHFFYQDSVKTMFGVAMGGPRSDRFKIVNDFLRGAEVSDAFYKNGVFRFKRLFTRESERISFEALFIEKMGKQFENNKIARAINNLVYLPKAEIRLLLRIGRDGNRFNERLAEQFPLYDYWKMRGLLKSSYVETLRIMGGLNLPEDPYHLAREIGYGHKLGHVNGYETIPREIRHIELGMSAGRRRC